MYGLNIIFTPPPLLKRLNSQRLMFDDAWIR